MKYVVDRLVWMSIYNEAVRSLSAMTLFLFTPSIERGQTPPPPPDHRQNQGKFECLRADGDLLLGGIGTGH